MRARWLLTHRDRCTRCSYPIAGLGVTANNLGEGIDGWVTCTECGSKSPAVAAWGEIIDDSQSDGATLLRYSPADPRKARAVHLVWTRHRLRVLARSAAICAAIAVVVCVGWWGAGEINIRWQASLARRERQIPEAITAMVRQGRPSSALGSPTVTDLVLEVHRLRREMWDDYMRRHTKESQTWGGFGPYELNITVPTAWLKTEEDKANFRAALELMVEMRDRCVFDLIDDIPSAAQASPVAFEPIDSPTSRDYTILSATRTLARICGARMRLARDSGNLDQFLRAWRAGKKVCDALENDATLLHWLTLTACEQLFEIEIANSLNSDASPEWIDAIAREWAMCPPRSIARTLEYEQAHALDNVAWYFSDTARVRKGLGAPELDNDLGIKVSSRSFFGWSLYNGRRLGTYEENRDAVNAIFARAKAAAQVEDARVRWHLLEDVPIPADLVVPSHILDLESTILRNLNVPAIHHRGISLMIMIEQYRVDHGEYPESLDDLGLAAVSPPLFDPFAMEPMRYKRVEPILDPYNRGYLLWSVGYDGEDNDATQGSYASWTRGNSGTDTVINDPNGLR